jgi:predicted metal-binding membrane protein
VPSPAAAEGPAPWVHGGLLVALVGGAWLALAWLGASAYAPYLSHAALGGPGAVPPAVQAAVFVAGWALMSAAMMLPSAFPLVRVFLTITESHGGLVALLGLGYLAVWAAFGLLAYAGDAALHALAEGSSWIATRPHLVPGAVLLAAGLFQFSPIKYACLRQCRSPVGFVVQHWRGGSRARRAVRLGALHGVYCVGCCWALMVLMFAVGGVHLGWMLALASVMFVEKAVGWGRRVTTPAGVVLALWGLAVLMRLPGAPLPF